MLQNRVCILVQSHADALTRPIQSTILSQNLQEYLSKVIYIAPADVQLVGKRALYILSASWRADSTKWPDPVCLKRCPRLSAHLSGALWAGRDCFLSAALLADATSLIRRSHAGTHSLSELAAFPSPGPLLAQHYLHASAAKLSRTVLQSQAKTSSFGNMVKELTEEKCL